MKLTVQDLRLGYNGRTAVDGVSFEVDPGEMVAIVGPNGSGKSTLLRGMSRLQKPSSGHVFLDGSDIRSISPRQVARRLAILTQAPDAHPDLTVRELVFRGRYPHQGILQRVTPADVEAVEWAMQAADTAQFATRPLGSLSGGERQRAWIALALAQQPRVLLLDEPTSFLDISHQVEVMHLLRRLNHEGMTVVAALHDLVLAARFADRVIALRSGRVEFDGPPARVMEPVGLERVFGVPMMVLTDPETGLPIPLPRPDPLLCPVAHVGA
jgi:iron complex transport system ATP-binding protein